MHGSYGFARVHGTRNGTWPFSDFTRTARPAKKDVRSMNSLSRNKQEQWAGCPVKLRRTLADEEVSINKERQIAAVYTTQQQRRQIRSRRPVSIAHPASGLERQEFLPPLKYRQRSFWLLGQPQPPGTIW